MNLEIGPDPAVEALAILGKAAANERLEPLAKEEVIRHTFGAPFPTEMLSAQVLPALSIYRLRDQDRDLGDLQFEDTSTIRFEYITPAAPLQRVDARWPLLRQVWVTLLGAYRVGRHPSVLNEEPVLRRGGLFRMVLGSARVDYGSIAAGSDVYPSFQAEIRFEGMYPTPESFFDDVPKCLRLANFEEIYAKWDVRPQTNQQFEAEDLIELEQD